MQICKGLGREKNEGIKSRRREKGQKVIVIFKVSVEGGVDLGGRQRDGEN